MHNKSIVITGASTGIGKACALHLDRAGFRVFAGVRKKQDGDALVKESSGNLEPLIIDIADVKSIEKAVRIVDRQTNGELYGLLNNAGLGLGVPHEIMPNDEVRQLVEVNVLGTFAATKAFLPLIRKARGRIVTTGSIFGRCVLPGRTAYAATKAALEAMTDSLRLELRPFGVQVSILEPGGVITELWGKIDIKKETIFKKCDPDLYKLYQPLIDFFENALKNKKYISADEVAPYAVHAFTASRPKPRYVIGSDAKMIAKICALPTRLRDRLLYKTIYG